MSIVTQTILESRVGVAELVQLTDDAGTGSVNAAVLAQAIADGEAEILTQVGQRYTLPLVLTNSMDLLVVTNRCLACVVYYLYVHRHKIVPETIQLGYNDSRKWAEKVAAGSVGLLGESQLAKTPAAGGGMVLASSEQVIDRVSMQGL